jgi:hypothetical protein
MSSVAAPGGTLKPPAIGQPVLVGEGKVGLASDERGRGSRRRRWYMSCRVRPPTAIGIARHGMAAGVEPAKGWTDSGLLAKAAVVNGQTRCL